MKRILAFLGLTVIEIGGAVALFFVPHWVGGFLPEKFLHFTPDPALGFWARWQNGFGFLFLSALVIVVVLGSLLIVGYGSYKCFKMNWEKAGEICERRK